MTNVTNVFFDSYNRAKQRYLQEKDVQLRPFDHLASAAEAGALVRTVTPDLVSFCDFVRLDEFNEIVLKCNQAFDSKPDLTFFLTANMCQCYLFTSIVFIKISFIHDKCIFLVLIQVCLFTNPIWLVKTRMQLQTPGHTSSYSGFSGNICLSYLYFYFLSIIQQTYRARVVTCFLLQMSDLCHSQFYLKLLKLLLFS